MLDDPEAPWDKPAFTQVWRGKYGGYSVRTERWRYTMWGKDCSQGEELYDYVTDPAEEHNLAGAPTHADMKARLKLLAQRNWAKPFLPTGG